MPSIKKTGFIERARQRLKAMLSLNFSAKQLAVASAIGVFIGISPYIGLHTYMAVTAASLLKLPVYAIILGTLLSNPITMPIIYAFCTKVGMWILRMDNVININWADIKFIQLVQTGKNLLLPFFLGTHVCGIVAGIFAYFIVYFIVNLYRKKTKFDLI